ncbi:hypothetical protein ABIA85_005986, partial [Bradyrhizobium sp. LA6.10]
PIPPSRKIARRCHRVEVILNSRLWRFERSVMIKIEAKGLG